MNADSMMHPIEHLASLHGIGHSYRDWRGEMREVSLEARSAILAALGVDTSDEAATASAISQHETVQWMRLLPVVSIAEIDQPIQIPISVPEDLQAKTLSWTITLEYGAVHTGTVELGRLPVVESGEADARTYVRRTLQLPAQLPLGYHTLDAVLDTGLTAQSRLIIAPSTCYQPEVITRGQRVWGIAVQLYSLRSERNWGIGDFGDLRELIRLVAPTGCQMIGLNPLHAVWPADPSQNSPYNPSNRLFLNVLYLSIPEVPEFAECEPAQRHVAQREFQLMLQELRSTKNVDYARVAAAKFPVLRMLYAQFRASHLGRDTSRALAFREFVQSHGDSLRLHALYDALDGHLRLQGPQYWGWPSWPDDYRDASSSTVNRFARERAEDVEYFLYLQWLAADQLAAAQREAREGGMSIGLYGDVAVGANAAGSETWSNRHLYLQAASVGAPPDALALKGQDWGIPPQDPNELRAQSYKPFVELVRNNMRHVAALRLDHVMTLYRLWWVPRGFSSKDGAYVHYPVNDLMAILALESQRNQCVVIGEDLGTVAEPMVNAMDHYRAYHYKVLLFEQEPSGRFKPPSAYLRNALATVTTHDLPTLRGWWEEHDLDLRDRLDLYPSEQDKQQAHTTRASERLNLMEALVDAGLWRWNREQPLPQYSAALSRAVHAFLGLSDANIALIQIEDLIGMTEPVNVPGTHTEHPNWQRKVTLNTAEIFSRQDVAEILGGMDSARKGNNPNA
jgi:4-alpha-glucanotransferase